MEVITSLSNKKVKDWCKLKNKKYRDEEGLFLVEGEHLVLEAIKSNLAVELMLEENTVFPIDILKCYATKEVLKKISSLDTPPNMIAIVKKKKEEDYKNKRYNPFMDYIDKKEELKNKVDRLISMSLGMVAKNIENLNLEFNKAIIDNIIYSGVYLRYKHILEEGCETNVQ